jgi:ERCC4-type nuclease
MSTASDTSSGLQLPALKSLGDLAEAAPIIRADSREQLPLRFKRLRCVYDQTLSEGDYQILGVKGFAVERKGSLDELAGNCVGQSRERLEKELFRLRPYRFKRLLIVGAVCDEDILCYRYRSAISPKCVLGSLYAWQARFDIPFVLTSTPEKASRLLELWAHYYCRELVQDANELLRGCRETVQEPEGNQ